MLMNESKVIEYLQNQLSLARTSLLKSLAKAQREARHNKYHRCLDMAAWCKAEADAAFLRYNWDSGRYAAVDFYEKWHKRWLALAEKFKEVK